MSLLDFRYISNPKDPGSQICVLILLEGDQNFLLTSEILVGVEDKQSPPFRVIFTQGPLSGSTPINDLTILEFFTTEALDRFLHEKGFN